MTIRHSDIQAMVDGVNSLALPAGLPGSFWREFDAWLFATSGAEIRIFLRAVDDRLVLTHAERSDTKEVLVFSTSLLADMEKFLTYFLCSSLREDKRLPRLLVVSIPVTIDKVAPGFTITKADGPGYELHHRGESVIRGGDDVELVNFSHYVSLSTEEIRQSALDPEGKPHFMVAAWS
ncbi:Imm61 family immunity protein [Leifsonia sp. NPDC014704]|uniref:Imm61 family immunity protein n=1 Tax=Leifsonia sp. NPDC014704 TaxID=3364123 RepID=UPI0036F46F71